MAGSRFPVECVVLDLSHTAMCECQCIYLLATQDLNA